MIEKQKNTTEIFPQSDQIDLLALFNIIWSKKWIIVGTSFIIAIIVSIITLQMPNIYQSQTTLLPVANEQSSLSQYSGLAAMAGMSIPGSGGGTDVEKIMALLNSRTLKERVIYELDLTSLLLEKEPTDISREFATLKLFSKNYSVSQDLKTGLITIKYNDERPELTSTVVNYCADSLSKILDEKNLTLSSKKLNLATDQLKRKEVHLNEVKERLLEFQRRTQVLQPESQAQGVMELYANLVQQKIALEIELETLKNALSDSNTSVKLKENQLKAITTQLNNMSTITSDGKFDTTDVPENIAEYTEIKTELELAQQMYIAMYSQWEQLRLEEQEDQLHIEVIDKGITPEEKIKPRRSIIVIISVLVFFLFYVFILIIRGN